MSRPFAEFFDRRLPDELDEQLARILSRSVPRLAADDRFLVTVSGRFEGGITADLLTFASNNGLDAALVLVDDDAERVLYFENGSLVGATSNVFFELIGRILYRGDFVDHDESNELIRFEEAAGPLALLGRVGAETLAWAAQRRVWEVVAALYLVKNGHFLFVEGKPDLHAKLRVQLDPMQVALEGLRQHDQWRHGPGEDKEEYVPPELADDAPGEATTDEDGPEEL